MASVSYFTKLKLTSAWTNIRSDTKEENLKKEKETIFFFLHLEKSWKQFQTWVKRADL